MDVSMRLTNLELSGFKSFGSKTILDFPARVIQIVGPNGSGKSNVAEAFRFVLGEQSIKSLRGKKGEDLIFNGSEFKPRANRASVKIEFDNHDRFLDIDFDTVNVERVVHRDGTNVYKINGSTVRLRDVMELLVGANIGATGHHIISQGEADKMLVVTPLERKSIIEDSLGLKIYHYRIKESERKLDKTEQNVSEVKSRRQELAPRVQYLKRQVEKIEKSREIREKLQEHYREYLKREEIYVKRRGIEIDSHLEELEKDRKVKSEELEVARTATTKEIRHDEYAEGIREARQAREEKRRGRDELMRKLGAIEGEISSYRRMMEKKPTPTVSAETVLLSDVSKLAETIRGYIRTALEVSDIEKLKRALENIRIELDTFIEEPKTVPQEFLEAQAQAQAALKELENQKDDIEGKLSVIQFEEDQLVKRVQELEAQWHSDQTKSEEEKRRVLELTHVVERLESQIERERERRQFLDRDKVRFEEELAEAGVLVGAYILQYKHFEPKNETGTILTDEEILAEDREKQEKRRKEIEKMKIRLEDMQISGGDEVIKEYQDIIERDEFLERELEDLKKSGDALRQLIKELEETLEKEFDEGIKTINGSFQEFFTLMFGGGKAQLEPVKILKRSTIEIEDEEPEVEQGIDVRVHIPKKNIKSLQMLSGGERTLTSLAMLFAMSQVSPPPFLILDETDAALDESNSKRYGDMIKHLSKHSQLIIITHNRETMTQADVLYGVTMGKDGMSKILSIKFEEAKEVAR